MYRAMPPTGESIDTRYLYTVDDMTDDYITDEYEDSDIITDEHFDEFGRPILGEPISEERFYKDKEDEYNEEFIERAREDAEGFDSFDEYMGKYGDGSQAA